MRFLLRISPNPGKVAPSLLSSLALFLTATGWHGSLAYAATGEDVAAASHAYMLEVLDELERNVHEQNSYLSDLQIKKSLETLSSLPPDASPGERGIELGFLGFYYLAYGSTEKAIETLEEAREILAAYGDIEVNPELRRVEGSLALAYMRLAENQNCCADASPESCIFPIRGEAIHDREVGARKALELFKRSIETRIIDEPIRYREMWLANVALMVLGESADLLPETWRIPEEFLSQESDQFPKFTNVAATAGVDTFSLSGGSIADDFDGDGIFDLVVSRWEPYGEMRYLRGGEGMVFEDLTSESNLAGIRGGLNLKQVDFDNDGDLDIYVMRGAWLDKSGRHPNSLLRNDGGTENGGVRFTDITFAAGLGGEHFPSQTADWADIDLDGDLDLFIGNESDFTSFPCQLFRNDGPDESGISQFTNITATAGIDTLAFVKGVVWGDFNGDRFPDLFLSCIHEPNVMWRNNGDGTFSDVTRSTGTAEPFSSFPAWFWDYNNDGRLDLFVSSYAGNGGEVLLHTKGRFMPDDLICRLYQNDGRGGFIRVERAVGLDMPMLPMGANFGDLTNDGFQDMYLGTGNPNFATIVPNILLSNEGGKFVERTIESRLGHLQKGHAISMADFDRDGDLDIFEQMGGAYRCDPFYDALFENPGTPDRGWISIRLRGTRSNSYGIGSRVRVVLKEGEKEYSRYQWMNSGGSFGANPLELHFGLGTAESIDRVEVFWPLTGLTQVVKAPKKNTRLIIEEEG